MNVVRLGFILIRDAVVTRVACYGEMLASLRGSPLCFPTEESSDPSSWKKKRKEKKRKEMRGVSPSYATLLLVFILGAATREKGER